MSGVPFDFNRPVVAWSALGTRSASPMTVGTAAAGGYLVDVDVLDAIDSLRPWSVSVRAGVNVVTGLKGNAVIPKTSTNVTAYWLATEQTSITLNQVGLDQVALTPHTVGALVTDSRLLSLQSPQTEPFVRRELLRTIGAKIDAAILNRAGSNEPRGVLNTASIGTQSGTSLAWSGVLTMQKTVGEANADDTAVSFIGTPAVRALLSAREKSAGSGFIWDAGRVARQPAFCTMDMPADTLIVGILAFWTIGLELAIDPSTGFDTGLVSIRCMATCDVGVPHPAAFSAATSIT